MDLPELQRGAEALGLSLTEDQLAAFEAFNAALYDVNSRMNLTRIAPEDAIVRHYLDSLLIQDQFPEGATVLDIGTGPGFPAWPLACARPDLQVTAMDSNGKMLSFLASQSLPNLLVVEGRAEATSVDRTFDVVTGRALAPLAIQLELSAIWASIGGRVIPMRTPADEIPLSAVQSLRLTHIETIVKAIPGSDIVRSFPVFLKERETPSKYPRRWSDIKTKPL